MNPSSTASLEQSVSSNSTAGRKPLETLGKYKLEACAAIAITAAVTDVVLAIFASLAAAEIALAVSCTAFIGEVICGCLENCKQSHTIEQVAILPGKVVEQPIPAPPQVLPERIVKPQNLSRHDELIWGKNFRITTDPKETNLRQKNNWRRVDLQMRSESQKKHIGWYGGQPFEYVQDSSTPIPDLNARTEQVDQYSVGVCHARGKRPTMEDAHIATAFDLNVEGQIKRAQLFAITDGHGGDQAAIFLANRLPQKLAQTLADFNKTGLTNMGVENALKIAFAELNEEFRADPNSQKQGSTATVAMILDGKLYIANVGDSRTILNHNGTPIQLSDDAKPEDPYYLADITNRGGFVTRLPREDIYRVIAQRDGIAIAPARAFGDHNLKGVLNPTPEVTIIDLSKMQRGKSHLILACDGIFDVASTRQVVRIVREHSDRSPKELAQDIVCSAYEAGSDDNLSVLVVPMNG